MSFVLVVSGSPAPVSKSGRLADHVCDALEERGVKTRHLRVRDLPPHSLLAGDAGDPTIERAVRLVEEADGVVFVTPTYKASYSGLMKAFLDLLPQYALAGKAALPLAVGGSIAHVMMLDYAFRPVLQSMGVRHCVQGCFLIESALDVASLDFVVDDRARQMLDQAIAALDQSVAARPQEAGRPPMRRRAADADGPAAETIASLERRLPL